MNHEVELALGKPVDWVQDQVGHFECPGIHTHTSVDRPSDCTVFLDYDAPTIHCFHSSCVAEVEQANKELRRAVGGGGKHTLLINGREISTGSIQRPMRSPRNRQEFLERRRKESRVTAAFTRKLEKVLVEYKWLEEDLKAQSPLAMPDDPREDWTLFLGLFEGQEGAIWVGNEYDSGSQQHGANFQTVDEWSGVNEPPGNFTCPSLFAPGTISRSNKNVCARPYLVLESDDLNKDDMAKVIQWLKTECKWRLRCVISTGGKSLHSWWVCPPLEWLPELTPALKAMKMDPAMFKSSQPVRVPGILRDQTNWQRIIYYNPHA